MQSTRMTRQKEYLLLLFLLLGTCMVLYVPFWTGDYYYAFLDANNDTFQSYLPVYQMIVHKLRLGDFSLMDMTSGMGANILSMQMVIFDPFAIVLYAVGMLLGADTVPAALIWVQILKVICAGLACHLFLSCFQLPRYSRVVASWIYAFSAFMVGGIGQHYMFATAPVFMALILYLIEKSWDCRKVIPVLAVCVCVLGVWSVYFCYMTLLAAGCYAILRFFQRAPKISLARVVSWFAPLLASVVIGVLLAGGILIPTVYQMLTVSTRISDTGESWLGKMLQPHSLSWLKTFFLRWFSEQAEGTMNRWQGDRTHFNSPHLYFSALLCVCLPQYVAAIWKGERGRTRSVTLAALLFAALSFVVPVTGIVFNAFVEYTARYVFVFLPAFAFIIAYVLAAAWQKHFFSKGAALVTIGGVCVAVMLSNWSERRLLSVALAVDYLAIIGALVGVFLLSKERIQQKRLIQCALFGIVGIGVVNESVAGLYISRNAVSSQVYKDGYNTQTADYMEQLNAENPSAFIRMENNFTGWGNFSVYDNSMAQRFRGTSFYNSIVNKNLQAFRETFGDGISKTSGYYSIGVFGRPMDDTIADLLGIQYVFSNYPSREQGWKLIYDYNDNKYGSFAPGYMYLNESVNTAGLLFYSWYTEQTLDSMTSVERQAALAFGTSLNQEAENVPMETPNELKSVDAIQNIAVTEWASQAADGTYEILPIMGTEQSLNAYDLSNGLTLNFDEQQLAKKDRRSWLSFDVKSKQSSVLTVAIDIGNGYDTFYWSNKTVSLGENEQQTVTVALPTDTVQVTLCLQSAESVQVENVQVLATDGKGYSNEGVVLKNPAMGGRIEGSVETQQPAILLIPVFYEPGWTAVVDGEPADILIADKGFCALELSQGTHTVALIYDTPGIKAGMLCSAVGGIAWLILVGWSWRFKKRI
ncbi:YfhO family protein [uncultured Ruthenibacterium sp.]|uniref:YfhO family protein n=1 Tax=uncultured Ruthenibacterium sp. TaxID=1905347 RepID=UPI00349E5CF4